MYKTVLSSISLLVQTPAAADNPKRFISSKKMVLGIFYINCFHKNPDKEVVGNFNRPLQNEAIIDDVIKLLCWQYLAVSIKACPKTCTSILLVCFSNDMTKKLKLKNIFAKHINKIFVRKT